MDYIEGQIKNAEFVEFLDSNKRGIANAVTLEEECFRVWGHFSKDRGECLYYVDKTESARWLRNPFWINRDRDDLELLFINWETGDVIGFNNFKRLDDQSQKNYYQFYKSDYFVVDGKINGRLNLNNRDGSVRFRGQYKDGIRDGLFMSFDKYGYKGVCGEYSNNKLVRTITGKLEAELIP